MNEQNYILSGPSGPPVQIGNVPDIKLAEIENEPRALDLDLAKRLGLGRHRDIRKLIDRNKSELERFGTCATVARVVRGNPVKEYWLNEEQALLVSALSDGENAAEVRHMLIKVFVAWRRGHLVPANTAELAPDTMELIRRSDGISRMLAHKVTGLEASVQAIASAVAAVVSLVKPAEPVLIRRGKTAKQIWDDNHLPPKLRGSTVWLGNRLAEMSCFIEDEGRADRGNGSVRLFDPDRAAICLRNGLLHKAKVYASERMGQGRFRLVSKETVK